MLTSLQCHIFQNQTYPFNQVVFFYKNEENILFVFKTKRWESEFNKKIIEVIEVLYMKHPPESGHIYEALDNYNELTLHKKWSFPLRIASFFMQCEVLGWPRIRPHAPQKKCISRLDLLLWSIATLRLLPDWSASICLSEHQMLACDNRAAFRAWYYQDGLRSITCTPYIKQISKTQMIHRQ